MDVRLQEKYNLYIDGKWVPASDGATLKVINPATGKEIANISEATSEDVDKLHRKHLTAGKTVL